jgi:hypothetical protein
MGNSWLDTLLKLSGVMRTIRRRSNPDTNQYPRHVMSKY